MSEYPKPVLIGLSGQARAGKDTFAEHIVKNYRFVRVGMADPMKRFCQELFDFSNAQMWGNERDMPDYRYQRPFDPDSGPGEPDFLTPRFALQTLGTEWGRNCYENVWIEYGIRVSEELLKGYCRYTERKGLIYSEKDVGEIGGVVFSDLRFKNELDAVKEAKGILIRIKRDGYDGSVGVQGHASEEEQKTIPDSYFDYIVENPPGLAFYWSAIDEVMRKIHPTWPWEWKPE